MTCPSLTIDCNYLVPLLIKQCPSGAFPISDGLPLMPARKRGSASSASQAGKRPKKAVEVEDPEALVQVVALKVNESYYVKVKKWQQCVESDPIMCHPELDLKPLTIAEGAPMAPYNAEDFKAAMEVGFEYSCTGCFGWHNPLISPTPGVSINEKLVLDGIDALKDPAEGLGFDTEFIFLVPGDVEYDPMSHLGGIKRISPCEFAHILLGGMHRSLEANCDDAEKRQWAKVRRSIKVKFVKLKPSEVVAGIGVYSLNMRENYKKTSHIGAWTTKQKVEFVLGEKHWLQLKLKKVVREPELSKHLQTVSMAKTSEPMNRGFVDAVLTIEKRLFSLEECRAVLSEIDQMDILPGKCHPLDSVYKMNTIVTRGRSEVYITWILHVLLDGLKMEFLTADEITVSKLSQVHCDVAILQLDFYSWFMKFLERHHFQHDKVEVIRKSLASHKACRQLLTNYPKEKAPDITWQNTWPESHLLALHFGED